MPLTSITLIISGAVISSIGCFKMLYKKMKYKCFNFELIDDIDEIDDAKILKFDTMSNSYVEPITNF